jgi:hypothetical protein
VFSFGCEKTEISKIDTKAVFYSKIENLVVWSRSEAVGYAVKRADKNTEVRRQNSE